MLIKAESKWKRKRVASSKSDLFTEQEKSSLYTQDVPEGTEITLIRKTNSGMLFQKMEKKWLS